MLGLNFLAYAEHRFDQLRPELAGRAPPGVRSPADDYKARSVLFVPEGARLCYVLLREHGPGWPNAVARRMVVPSHRNSGQAHYVEPPVPVVSGSADLVHTLDWARGHLDADLSVGVLAEPAATSPRSFAQHFRAATGTTLHTWVLWLRIARAEELLEAGDLPVEAVPRLAGFGTAAALRLHFGRRRDVPPGTYRRPSARRHPDPSRTGPLR